MAEDPISDYLRSIGRVPLLTPAEEIQLGHTVQKLMALLEAKPDGPYTKEERLLIRRGQRAKDRMINANLRLVVSVAKKFVRVVQSLDMLDLIQEGNIGLVRAVEKFDPERGYKFSTYAFWWIRQGITRATWSNERLIKLPSAAAEAVHKVANYKVNFKAEHGRGPTIEECAEYCKVGVGTMRGYLKHANDCQSLDSKCANARDGRGSSLVELIPDPSSIEDLDLDTEEQVHKAYVAYQMLSDREQELLAHRFGLDGREELSLEKIGKLQGVSRQGTRDQEVRTLRKLRLLMQGQPPGKLTTIGRPSSLNWRSKTLCEAA